MWEFTGILSRSVAVGSAKINLQELQLDQQVVGNYPLFVPPPSSNNASYSGPFAPARRTGSAPIVTRGADASDGSADEMDDKLGEAPQ